MFYEDGYVTVSDPQSFKKPRSMNKIEMTSLLVSLDLLKSLRTDDVAKEIEALKLKLQENMRFENPFVVVQNMENTEMVEAIERAIARSTLLRIDYASGTKDSTSVRDILPIEIYVANGSTYLNAWCQSSKGDRTFRLDRILNYEMIEGSVVNQTRETSVQAVDSSSIELLVSKSARNFIEDNRAIIGHIQEGEQLRIELNPIDREWLVRTILGFGGQIEVSKPKELALEVVSRAQAIKESYGN
jgi:proteasome accessory factor C